MIARLLPRCAAPLLALALTACSGLPAASPTVNQLLKPLDRNDVEVVDITPATPSGETALLQPQLPWTIGDAQTFADGIATGDVLSVTIYEVGYSLFGGGQTGGAGIGETGSGTGGDTRGGAHRLPAITVPENGVIHLPYAGAINVAGRSGDAVARTIEARLRGKSQFAQAVVAVASGPQRSVVVSGDVARPGRVGLTSAHERLLDAIALAAGPQARGADTLVRLTRGGQISAARLDEITTSGPMNVTLAPGDSIELSKNVRSLTVLGAAKSVSEIPFDSARLTLSEALARAGGLLDNQSDATGVFIFRYELREREGMTVRQPVIYRLNLLKPTSYFAAQQFEMRQKDVMLVANARTIQLNKVIQTINSLAAPIVTVDILTRP